MDAEKLGKKIKMARISMDLSQDELAEKLQCKQKSISNYESGIVVPKLKTLSKIACILQITLEDLVSNTDEYSVINIKEQPKTDPRLLELSKKIEALEEHIKLLYEFMETK